VQRNEPDVVERREAKGDYAKRLFGGASNLDVPTGWQTTMRACMDGP